jgi:hypothetical protein
MRNRLVGRVGPVGVVVVADEVEAALDARRRGTEQRSVGRSSVRGVRCVVGGNRAGAAEVRVRVVDAGVDHGDLDLLAVQAIDAVPHGGSTDQGNAALVVGLHGRKRPYRDDVGDVRDLVGLAAVDANLEAVVRGLVVGHDGAAQLLDGLLDARLRDLELGLDRVLLGVAQLAVGVPLDECRRVARYLNHHCGGAVAQAKRSPFRLDQPVRVSGLRCARG